MPTQGQQTASGVTDSDVSTHPVTVISTEYTSIYKKMTPFTVYKACRTFKMTNKRFVTEKVKMCICTICFCMCVIYVFWYMKHRLFKKSDLPTLFFFYVRPINQFLGLSKGLCI